MVNSFSDCKSVFLLEREEPRLYHAVWLTLTPLQGGQYKANTALKSHLNPQIRLKWDLSGALALC